MPVGKKMGVVLSVVITGISVALFFRKDASPLWFWSRRSDDPFAQQVERRVGGPSVWTTTQPTTPQLPMATAAITPSDKSASAPPGFPQAQSPVGSLLAPIEGIVDDVDSGRYDVGTVPAFDAASDSTAASLHRVADGDTLTKLAVQYLGRADAYLQIYELNRDVLSSPDLLPIGAVLRIPARSTNTSPTVEATTGMVPLPPRPGT